MKDGGTLISYGEFARVADRVVLSVPIGDLEREPSLHVISVPESAVDWRRTDEYSLAVRSRRYAETRGEEDYAILTGHVTLVLNDLQSEPNPVRRLAMAEEARRNLAAWPAANFGYKAKEVAQLVSLFDEAIGELRAAAGQKSFDLSLVAMTEPPPPPELLPVPDVQDTIESAFAAAMVSTDAGERTALLRTLLQGLEYAPASADWAKDFRGRIAGILAAEKKIDKSYADLTASLLKSASSRAARADVHGLQNIIARALRADEALGRKRPGEMAALLASLDAQLDEARRVRLARDAWILRQQTINQYRAEISGPLDRLASFRKWLDAIRDLSGPDPRFLRPLEERAALGHLELGRITPPAEAQTAHGLVAAALQMTRQAAVVRRNAVSSNDIRLAWDASAAAAGALTLADRAVEELQRLISSQPR